MPPAFLFWFKFVGKLDSYGENIGSGFAFFKILHFSTDYFFGYLFIGEFKDQVIERRKLQAGIEAFVVYIRIGCVFFQKIGIFIVEKDGYFGFACIAFSIAAPGGKCKFFHKKVHLLSV